MYPFIPEGMFPITIGPAALGDTAITEYINVSEAEMVWLVIQHTNVAATDQVITPLKAYTAAGGGSAVLGFDAPIWYGTAVAGLAITLARQTDAANFTTSALAGVHITIIQIDPAALGAHATLGDYKYLSCTTVGAVGDYAITTAWVKPRYQSDTIATTRWIV